ncbi:MAG: RluA family pseudouridine synthase [Erysipelotrichaceae bacterium]|nr:RluA family pseudouridine synthase [Erysipelotrichaceae bacterium]
MKSFSVSYDAKAQCLSFHIHQSISVDDILMFFSIARKQRYLYYHNRLIKLNNLIITQSKNCQNGDIVVIDCRQAIVEQLPLWNRDLDICYEDDLCLIVNKPSGVLVHSDGVNQNHTLHNMVQAYYHKQNIHAPIRAIHRLDKDTSGLLFYCKLPFFQAYFDKLLQEKQISRKYLAWCFGSINSAMIIDKSIARDRHHANKMCVSDHGAYAQTHVEPLALHANCTLAACRLKTGRTHQIRVHLASIKHPLLSDPLYGFRHPKAQRLALHAWELQFYHPLKKEIVTISCPVPDDFPFLTISKKVSEKR